MNSREIAEILSSESYTNGDMLKVLSHFPAENGQLLSSGELFNSSPSGELFQLHQAYLILKGLYEKSPIDTLAMVVERDEIAETLSDQHIGAEASDRLCVLQYSLFVGETNTAPILGLDGVKLPGQCAVNVVDGSTVEVSFEVRAIPQPHLCAKDGEINTRLSLKRVEGVTILALDDKVIPGQQTLSYSEPNRWGIREEVRH